MLHATARSVYQLAAFRFLLGLGEAGNWPGAAKVAAEWFPVRERAFAMGIFNSGASIGALVAPPLIVWVALTFGWRYAFFIGAILSSIVMVIWFFFYQTPDKHPTLSDEERAHIVSDQPREMGVRRAWLSLFQYRQVWALIAARFFTDPIWWFLISWLPNYLKNARGFSLALIGMLAWIPFLFADIGTLSGGAISSVLIRRGWSVDRARRTVMISSIAVLVPAGVALVVGTKSDVLALVGISMIAFGFQSWITNLQTTPSDVFPRQDVGSVAGIGGTAAGIASICFTLLVGWIVDNYSYTPVYLIVACMGPIGAFLYFFIIKRIERIPESA
jgi:MFS transporter, ACS family, hexuronate transporter